MTTRTMGLLAACMGLTLTWLATGCDTVKAPGAATPDPVSAAAYPQVTALEGLGDYVSMDKPIVTQDGKRPLLVVVPVRLRSDREVNAQYRFRFFDDRGRPVHPEMEWRYQVLPARAQIFLEASAPDLSATQWRLDIRPAR